MNRSCIAAVLVAGTFAAVFAANGAVEVKQIFRAERFNRGDTNVSRLQEIDAAHWVWHPTAVSRGEVGKYAFLRFRKEFMANADPLTFDVSADERFVLLLDGKRIAEGPHRGSPENWLYQSYEAKIAPGKHVMEAVVWVLGPYAPSAQLSWRGGFILKAAGAYHKQLTTGIADWRVAELHNTRMLEKGMRKNVGVGAECEVRGCSLLDEKPQDGDFVKVKSVRAPVKANSVGLRTPGWMLFPTIIPDQTHERMRPGAFRAVMESFGSNDLITEADATRPMVADFNALLKEGKSLTIAPNVRMSAMLDLEDYFCAYPEMTVSGGKGAEIRWTWAESLLDAKKKKGNRNAFVGKTIAGGRRDPADRFFPDGRDNAFFTVPWWRTGRWCKIEIKTADEPLTLNAVSIAESRYPITNEGWFKCSDHSIEDVLRVCVRGIVNGAHDTLLDPHYEQQMYLGDCTFQCAMLTALTSDDRLTRRAMDVFDFARRENGMLPMNFPTVGTQESAIYTIAWPITLDEWHLRHDNPAWLKAKIPGLCHTMFGLAQWENADGLLENLPGWSFIDWVPEWRAGIAPDGRHGVSALNNLFYLLALQSASRLARDAGDAALGEYWAVKADALGRRIVAAFWDATRGMLADNLAKNRYSQHAQALAVIAGSLSPEQEDAAFKALIGNRGIAKATNSFRHFLYAAYAKKGRTDLFLESLASMRAMVVKYGLKTPLEDDNPEARSDCHAWGANPLLHLHTDVAGVMPAEPGFKSVRIAPQPSGLKRVDCATPHPRGLIHVKLYFDGDAVEGEVTLPDGIGGVFEWKGRRQPLKPGCQTITR